MQALGTSIIGRCIGGGALVIDAMNGSPVMH
jgi:hypothetical protein